MFDLEQYRKDMEDFRRRHPTRPGFMLRLDGVYEKVPVYKPRRSKNAAWPAWAQEVAGYFREAGSPLIVLELLTEFLERR